MSYVGPSQEFLERVWYEDRLVRFNTMLRVNGDIVTRNDFYRWLRNELNEFPIPDSDDIDYGEVTSELRAKKKPWCAIRCYLRPRESYSCGCKECKLSLNPRFNRRVFLDFGYSEAESVKDEWGESVSNAEVAGEDDWYRYFDNIPDMTRETFYTWLFDEKWYIHLPDAGKQDVMDLVDIYLGQRYAYWNIQAKLLDYYYRWYEP